MPAVIATCDSDGVPNVSMISQVHYVDADRVALSYQFFNKTRRNLLGTGAASVSVVDPIALVDYRLDLAYEETQTQGPLFESMKAKLAGIASHTGMQGVFHLRGADVFRVLSVTPIPMPVATPSMTIPPINLLSAVRRTSSHLTQARELGELFDRGLECLQRHFRIEHAMVLMLDTATDRLFTVASVGYAQTGIGSELAVGDGVIGVAAREGFPIRIGHMTSEYSYGATVREQVRVGSTDHHAEAADVPYPGLTAPESQIALPILSKSRVIGVLFAESVEPMRFRYDDEDALALVADRMGDLIGALQQEDASAGAEEAPSPPAATVGQLAVKHYEADDSIFVDHEYLIKGVAGAVLWKVLNEHAQTGRTEFSNRELRLDPALRLPAYSENLEARLVLLQRRLLERESSIRIVKSGRGRFHLVAPGKLTLEHVGSDVPAAV